MCGDDAGVDFVAVLPAWAGAPRGLDVDLSFIERELRFDIRVEHGNRHGRSLHTTALLGWRHSLKAMPSSLMTEELLGSFAGEEDRDESRSFVYEFGFKDPSDLQRARRSKGGP